jgi:hypothetical protein
MKTPATLQTLRDLFDLGLQLATLPVAKLCFHTQLHPQHVRAVYENFTRPHPRSKVFRNKSLGVALVDLTHFASPSAYLESLRQCGRAGQEGRRARARGYRIQVIDRNDHVDDIHAINTSSEMRQGRPMDPAYRQKRLHFEPHPHFRCYGVFSAQDQLVAYCNVAYFGNFATADQLLGYKNQDGVMYMLLADIICELIDERRLNYFMYDTYFGAKPGMRAFKRRFGFRPYRARYAIN